MNNKITLYHPRYDKDNINTEHYLRTSARAIIIKDQQLLLMYSKAFNDYTFPGGGKEINESIETCLIREIREETGAIQINNYEYLFMIKEFVPYEIDNYHNMQMDSYYYFVDIGDKFIELDLEDYEIRYGLSPVWVNLNDALVHNEKLIKEDTRHELFALYRETYVLNKIKEDYFKGE